MVLTLALILLCGAVLAAYAARVARSGRPELARLGPSPGTALLPGKLVEAFYWAMHAPVRALVWLGVSPNALTYASLFLCVVSGPLIATGHFTEAAVVVITGAALDAMDGMVARARRMDSPAGALLDSCLDRAADAAPFVGLAVFYRHHVATLLIPLLAMVAASLLSYTRAKTDGHGLKLPSGLMRRHERVVYLAGSLLLAPLAPELSFTPGVFYPLGLVGPVIIAVVGTVAACLLIARAQAALLNLSPAPSRSYPAPKAPHLSPGASRQTGSTQRERRSVG